MPKYQIYLSNRTKKYIKKLKDKHLRKLFRITIYHEIKIHPYNGTKKHGDLKGIFTWGLKYRGTQYRIAYTILKNCVIPIFCVGPHENFYKILKHFLDNSSIFKK